MQYFTFIGTSPYSEVAYSFQDNPQLICQTKFIQEAVIHAFVKEIDRVYIFCTDVSRKGNGEELKKIVEEEYRKEVFFIEVNEDVQTEEIVLKMNQVLDSDFIIDVTHSFRNIPIAVTLITRYLEYSKGYHLKHLYYGNFNRETNSGKVIDLLRQYQNSQLVNELESFDRYLKVSNESLMKYEESDKINKLLHSFDEFNKMIEYCEFDKSIEKIRSITEVSRSILKDADYVLIHPYLENIIQKFELVLKNNQMKALRKIALIRILLDHHLYQLAITFTDQLIREEMVHYAFVPKQKDFNVVLLKRLPKYRKKEASVYDLSQALFDFYEIRGSIKIDNDVEKYVSNKVEPDFKLKVRQLKQDHIIDFYNKIRNCVNHGKEINQDVNVIDIINKCLDTLTTFIKEG